MSSDEKLSFLKKQLLGKILLGRNIITQGQLKQALEVQKKEEECLGRILVNLGFLEEYDIVVALVVQCHIPYIAIDKYEIDQSIAQLVPAEMARKYHVVPLDRVNDILSIVMEDPLDTMVKVELQRATQCRLAPFIATQREIEKAIHKCYDDKS